MFVINILSIKHHNKSYDYEDNDKQAKTNKNSAKFRRRKCRSHFKHYLCSENFISDQLAGFSLPMGTIIFGVMGKYFKKNQNYKKIRIMKTRDIEVLKLIVIR